MPIRLYASLLSAVILLVCARTAAYCEPIKDWQSLILHGRNAEEARKYADSISDFSKAAALCESAHLPPKYLPISLCRQIRSLLLAGQVNSAEPLFNKLVSLAETQKHDKTFDPEVGVWMADVADTYMSNKISAPPGLCIKHANTLKMLAIDVTKKEYFDSLMTLARFYVENGQIDDGIRIIVRVQTVKEAKTGKNDLPNVLFQEGVHCKVIGKLEPAKALALIAIEKTKSNSAKAYKSCVPAYCCFIAMCALAGHHDSEVHDWLLTAAKAGKKATTELEIRAVKAQLLTLIPTIKADEMQKKLTLAESEYELLLTAQRTIFPEDLPEQYATLTLLTSVLATAGKCAPFEKYIRQSIAIAQKPENYVSKDLPDLYKRLGMVQFNQHQVEEASKSFSKSLELDKTHDPFHDAETLCWWGFYLIEHQRYSQAEDKLNKALGIARKLPVRERGTIVADSLQILSFIQMHNGNRSGAEASLQQSAAEIQLQKKAHSKLGPDIYHRTGS